ncbi:hypothetical protein A4A49_62700, partial [Nicotiana attenuata]
LKTVSEINFKPFRLAGLDIPKSFFTALVDPTSDVSDERAIEHVQNYARLIPHCLKYLNFGTHNKTYGENSTVDCGIFALKFLEMRLKQDDVFKFNQSDALAFKLSANLGAHAKWNEDSGYETPEEQLGHDYGEYEDTLFELFR